jgi:hypothetical protein
MKRFCRPGTGLEQERTHEPKCWLNPGQDFRYTISAGECLALEVSSHKNCSFQRGLAQDSIRLK